MPMSVVYQPKEVLNIALPRPRLWRTTRNIDSRDLKKVCVESWETFVRVRKSKQTGDLGIFRYNITAYLSISDHGIVD